MAFIHGKDSVVLFGQYNLSSYFNEASTTRNVEPGETTTFGAASGAKTYVVGLQDGTASVSGLFDGSASAVDVVLSTALTGANVPVTIVPGTPTLGLRAHVLNAISTSYEVSSPVADVVSATAEFQADGGVDSGVVYGPLTSISATGDGAGVDNGASTANGGVAHLHVPINTRDGAITFKVQHSATDSAYADLVTFTATTASTPTSQRVVVAAGTTVNRWTQIQYTVAGSTGAASYVAAFARR